MMAELSWNQQLPSASDGRVTQATEASEKAKKWINWSMICGVIWWGLIIILPALTE